MAPEMWMNLESHAFTFWYCSALVEVKPILFVAEDTEATNETLQDISSTRYPGCMGFQPAEWHDSCVQKCIVPGKFCAVILSLTSDLAVKICSDYLGADHQGEEVPQTFTTTEQMENVSRFCIYLLDKIIIDNGFSWKDTMVSTTFSPVPVKVDSVFRLYSHSVIFFCST